MIKKEGVGVAIGRFQVHKLHEGHLELIGRANAHTKLVVFICTCPHLVTPNDPLDYPTREQMVREAFPTATVFPLPDNPTDEGWSVQLDGMLHAHFPTDRATLYWGRGSSISHYHGNCKTTEIDEVPYVSGTDLRAEVGKTVQNNAAFRAGIIYAAHNMWSRTVACVDIAMTRYRSGNVELLLGKRRKEGGKVRLPGGHVNISDDGGITAAKRELGEETQLEAGSMEIVGFYRVPTWRASAGLAYFTALYHAEYVHGAPVGSDDIDEVFWVPLSRALAHQYADGHDTLVTELISFLARKEQA